MSNERQTTNPREVNGAVCREVVDALAVVAAIALNGDASETPSTREGASPAVPDVPAQLEVGRLRSSPTPTS
jgi:hypothetical protein